MVGRTAARPNEICSTRTKHTRTITSPRRRIVFTAIVLAISAIAIVAYLPADQTSARPAREGGSCGDPDGCHSGGQTSSMLTVTGLPVGTYEPGLQYTLTITVTDTNADTGENAFDLLVTAGSLSTTDPNAEINTPTSGYTAEASSNDLATPMKATTWTVVWTAPSSGDATLEIWAVMGDGATGTLDIWDHETHTYSAIPEFTTLLVPIIGVIGAVVLASRISKRKS